MSANPTQLVLDLPFRPALERDDFYVSDANRLAVTAIDSWPDWSNPVLVLTGGAGCGKSHLANVWQHASKAKSISVDQLDIASLPSFLSQGALVVEDLPGDGLDETALFHLINLTRERGAWLLLTASQPAAMWNLSLPDLKSRLAAAGSASLSEPDDALLRAILIKQFADRQLNVDEATISYMVSRMERSAGAARDLVSEIDSQALRQKANVTRRFVSGIMNQQFSFPEI